MDRRLQRLIAGLGLALALLAAAPVVYAQSADDPAAAVNAYVAALNAHDLNAALALFDQNGSATDARGRHFDGRAGLTEFLLANGFGAPDARITTNQLQVFGNRGLWTYSCTCTSRATDVRVVLSHNKIIVFFMARPVPGAASAASPEASIAPWLAALGLATAALGLIARGLSRGESLPPPRPAQGRLLAGLKAFKNA